MTGRGSSPTRRRASVAADAHTREADDAFTTELLSYSLERLNKARERLCFSSCSGAHTMRSRLHAPDAHRHRSRSYLPQTATAFGDRCRSWR